MGIPIALAGVWQLPATDLAATGDSATVAVDATGIATAVWWGGTGGTYVVEASRSTSIGSWTAAEAISAPDAARGGLQVVADPSGVVTVVWAGSSSSPVNAARYAGGAWSVPQSVSVAGGGVVAESPAIAADSSGVVTAAWRQIDTGTGDSDIRASRWSGSTWSNPVTISATGAGQDFGAPKVAAGPAGSAVVVWQDNVSQRVQASHYSASTWSAPVNLSASGALASSPRVAMNASGTATALWTLEQPPGSPRVIQAAQSAGGSWSTPSTLSEAARVASSPGVAADGAGNFTSVWVQSNGSNDIVKASRYSASGWSAAADLSAPGAHASQPQVAGNSAGGATAVWRRFVGSDRIAQAAQVTPSGEWSAVSALSPTGETAYDPQVALDDAGAATVVWNNGSSSGGVIKAVREITAPSAPGTIAALAGSGSAKVSWSVPLSDGGSSVTSYTATASPGGATCNSAAPVTTCTVAGLSNGTAYTFTVTATNAVGTGWPSAPSAAVTPQGASGSNSSSPSAPGYVPTLTFASRTASSTQVRSVTLTTKVRVNGAGRVVQMVRPSGGSMSSRGAGTRSAQGATRGPVLCTARRGVPRAGTYRMTCTLGAAARAQLTRRALRVDLTTVFIATDGQRVTRRTTARIARIPAPRLPVTG